MANYMKSLLISVLAVFAPIKALLISVGFLVVSDMITGIWAAKKRKDTIKSAEMRRTISKMLVYQIAVISAFVLQKFLLDNIIPVSNIVAGVIGMVEFQSILENSSTIAGQDIKKLILKKLGSVNDNGTDQS